MDRVHLAPLLGLGGAVVVLACLATSVGVGPVGWVVGAATGAVLAATLDRALARHRRRGPGPAGWVTTTRAALVCGVAALTADGLAPGGPGSGAVGALVVLSAAALVLDAVDGHVARRTGTATALGARYDMEVDAFLIAVLSVQVAQQAGWWVLAIGAMRYAYVAASWPVSWLRRPVPPRFSAKVVAAVQGIVLTVAAADLVPALGARAALAVALVLLAHSFGVDVWRQWRQRHLPLPAEQPYDAPPPTVAAPTVPAAAVTTAAAATLWLALAPPRTGDGLGLADFVQIPVEGLALVAVALVVRSRLRTAVAVGFGVAAAAVVLLRVLDLGFDLVMDRSFHLLSDWSYLGKGVDVLNDTAGGTRAVLAVVGAAVLTAALLALLPLAALRLTRVASDHRRRSAQVLLALGTVWAVCAVVGGPAAQVAGARAAALTVDTVDRVRSDVRDREVFEREIADDPFAATPPDRLLTGLRGKDVLLVWVESYGRVALDGSSYPGVLEVLRAGDERLAAAGYRMRSAFLTSPTFGAGSWLAHATLQAGVWVDSEQRYGQLLASDRLSLTSAFERAGWRTVFQVPANTEDWPEGAAYYGFDQIYDSRNAGYRGPEFGYASMPDQYTLDWFRRTELTPADRRPVFAEIDLVSSHHPWTPLPELVPWPAVGDGSVFDGMPERGERAVDGEDDPGTARRLYGESIEYALRTLVSFLLAYPDPDRVLVVAGDHQPHSFVSGDDAGHDVPVTVLAQDPAVLRRIGGWGWQEGLLPAPDAPVWRMDELRDRLLAAYGPRR